MSQSGGQEDSKATSKRQEGQLAIHKIYVKDVSFEAPNAPEIFRGEWRPDVDIQLHSDAKRLSPDLYEVVLKVTVTAKLDDKTAFLVEVYEAGIFGISGVPEAHLGPMLGSFCPNILFPYARETISDLVARGGFPQLILAPVNFDALYAKHQEEKRGDKTSSEEVVH